MLRLSCVVPVSPLYFNDPLLNDPKNKKGKAGIDRVDAKLQLTTITKGKNTNKHRERGE
jgi:hypothetical protein